MSSPRLIQLLVAMGALSWSAAFPGQEKRTGSKSANGAEALLDAIVRVNAKALSNARSNATLGREREGSGIVIDSDGHILTIGYLVIEPDTIVVRTNDDRTIAATLAGYDHTTGFALLKAQEPLDIEPMRIGSSGPLAEQEPVLVIPHEGAETASLAYVVSKRLFSGSWEYMLDSAIYTAPPNFTWAGAALVNRELRLVGVGSLFVGNAGTSSDAVPGNMFVPIDLLKPILDDLLAIGKRAGLQRPWLGMATEELAGRVFVTRISVDSPADKAGIRPSDIVLGVGNAPVRTQADLYRKVWGLGAAGIEVPLKVLQGMEIHDLKVRSIDRTAYFRKKPLH
jgi:S1-C subfamily serine protease